MLELTLFFLFVLWRKNYIKYLLSYCGTTNEILNDLVQIIFDLEYSIFEMKIERKKVLNILSSLLLFKIGYTFLNRLYFIVIQDFVSKASIKSLKISYA